jgi:hypothetical protein
MPAPTAYGLAKVKAACDAAYAYGEASRYLTSRPHHAQAEANRTEVELSAYVTQLEDMLRELGMQDEERHQQAAHALHDAATTTRNAADAAFIETLRAATAKYWLDRDAYEHAETTDDCEEGPF